MIYSQIPLVAGNNNIFIPLVFDDGLYSFGSRNSVIEDSDPYNRIREVNNWLTTNGIYSKLRLVTIPVTKYGWQISTTYPISFLAECILNKTGFFPYDLEYEGNAALPNGRTLSASISQTDTVSSAEHILCRFRIYSSGMTGYECSRRYGANGDSCLVSFLVLPSADYEVESLDSSKLRIFSLSITATGSNTTRVDASVLGTILPQLNNIPISDLDDVVDYKDPFTPKSDYGTPGAPSSQFQGGDGTGGGWGDFDYSSDGPQDKNPPTISTYDAGFCTLYAATQAQIKALADYMWADTNDFLNNWNKLWANPMDAILGISLVPLSGLLTGVSTAVKVGNIATNVYMTKLTASIVRVDCGSLYITSQSLSHSFMDFPPYNQIQLYLPYVGTVEISATDVIDKYISISYLCDCLSGACVAFVMSNGYTIATYSGNIAAAVPVTSGDFANIVFAALDYLKVSAGGMATAAALSMAIPTGGLSAMALPMAVGLGAGGIAAAASQKQKDFQIGQSILVPQITKGGPAGSVAGYMNHQKPFLIFNAPNVAAPENMNTYIGYAQYETKTLGSCHGFTKVAEIHYRGAGTEAERTEIENLLRMGVDL